MTSSGTERAGAWARKAAEHPVVSCRSPFLYPIVVVALNTGTRKSEILGLEWDRVVFSRGVIQLE